MLICSSAIAHPRTTRSFLGFGVVEILLFKLLKGLLMWPVRKHLTFSMVTSESLCAHTQLPPEGRRDGDKARPSC